MPGPLQVRTPEPVMVIPRQSPLDRATLARIRDAIAAL